MSTRQVPTPAFWHGDTVYLQVNSEPNPGKVTRLMLMPGSVWVYRVQFSADYSDHYDFELTTTPSYGGLHDKEEDH